MARQALTELAAVFLKLGTIAFGGPAAHIAIMEDEVVRRRQWLTREQFLDYVGATNLIPGPNSTELAIHIGLARAGWAGLAVAGLCFILPAAAMVGGLAWAYMRYGTVPVVGDVLYGIKPVVIAVVGQAIAALGRTALKTRLLTVLAGACATAAALGMHELLVLLAAGIVSGLWAWQGTRGAPAGTTGPEGPRAQPAIAGLAAAGALASPAPWTLFLAFAKIGSVLFGSGYVLLAFLRADFVERLGWITEQQLLDAIVVGQVTPGPVFTTATFIGYLVSGPSGALAATVGIFLPAFFFVAISGPLVPRLRRSAVAGGVLDGVNVASLALMVVVTWHLGRSAVVDPLTAILAALALVALLRFRVSAAWLVLAGAVVGGGRLLLQ